MLKCGWYTFHVHQKYKYLIDRLHFKNIQINIFSTDGWIFNQFSLKIEKQTRRNFING